MKKRTRDGEPSKEGVAAGQWKERARARVAWRTFPGPPGANALLRVSLTRTAFAEITSHGKESLEGEVCGVLAGEFGEDDDGLFVDVQACVRGTGARAGRGHVTFTQDTWNGIHAALEKDHPKLQIVGWYHTHPGFGVEFSEMDVFIQRNFFSLPAQVALVLDPLGGDVGLAINGAAGIEYVDRFWVDSREHRARIPSARGEAAESEISPESLRALEARVDQLVGTVRELRTSLNRFLLTAAVVGTLALTLVVGYGLFRAFTANLEPPRGLSYVPIPVMIEGKPALIGVAVVKWNIPDDLIARAPEEGQVEAGAPTAAPALREEAR